MSIKRFGFSLILTVFITLLPNTIAVASSQDFYFTDFTADYYLTKQADGTSKLHVKEVLTAVFPDYDQNHGINREIPMYNQGKKNRTVKNQGALNLTVLRNGLPEKINKIENEGDYYNVYIGDADVYVHGEQVYTLEYDYTDVITEFDKYQNNVSGRDDVVKLFQELYWDSNGTGWRQSFEKVTARLHLETDAYNNLRSDVWCYVGRFGTNDPDRCTIVNTADGYSFSANNLKSGENLTFVVSFEPGTFNVVMDKSYILVILLIIEIIISLFVIIRKVLRWKKEAKMQQNLYRSTFVAPQYQPPENRLIHVAEGEQIYLKGTKTSYVATLLELAVAKAVSITKVQDEKKPKKNNWSIHLNVDPSTLSKSQVAMLNILADKKNLSIGEDIIVKKHTATKTLASYASDYKSDAESVLSNGGYLIKKKISTNKSSALSMIITKIFTYTILLVVGASMLEDVFDGLFNEAAIVIGGEYLPFIMIIIFVVAIIINTIFTVKIDRYAKYTKKGIELVKYLEGLELYIKMAEKDRLKFLQSVEGADTSNAGIVKLYEKLLPWASLFGVEKSWVEELEKYYKIEDVPEGLDTNLLHGIIASNIIHDVNYAVNASTSYHESSGGSGSSFSSGGGGGGFSGGGGGGGGGGGW